MFGFHRKRQDGRTRQTQSCRSQQAPPPPEGQGGVGPGGGACQTLMSWDSTILASVFFTLRMVRREAGLGAQHSDMSFSMARRHWGGGQRETHRQERERDRLDERYRLVSGCLLLLCIHLVAVPAVGDAGPQAFDTHHLQHVFIGGLRRDHVEVRQLVVFHQP